MDIRCSYQLEYYPFDTQVYISCTYVFPKRFISKNIQQMCKMVFSVQGKTDNYVTLRKDGEGVDFLGNHITWKML